MLTVKQETKAELLGRKKVVFSCAHEKGSTPSRLDLRKKIAKQLKVSEDVVAVLDVRGQYGSQACLVEVHVYDKVEDCAALNPMKEKDKKKIEEASKKVEEEKKAAEEAKEAPVEEKTEEKTE